MPDRLRAFTSCSRCTDYAAGVHFFLDDYRFEWAWSDPLRYVDMLRRFKCVLTPDFSCYVDMPEPMQRWNVYRGRAVGRIWQMQGLNVIPTLTWGFENSYSFCFDGIPTGSVVALSTVGLMRGKDGQRLFADGAGEAARRLKPSAILAYGEPMEFDDAEASVIWYQSDTALRFKAMKERK
jgi:hypothetical protein